MSEYDDDDKRWDFDNSIDDANECRKQAIQADADSKARIAETRAGVARAEADAKLIAVSEQMKAKWAFTNDEHRAVCITAEYASKADIARAEASAEIAKAQAGVKCAAHKTKRHAIFWIVLIALTTLYAWQHHIGAM